MFVQESSLYFCFTVITRYVLVFTEHKVFLPTKKTVILCLEIAASNLHVFHMVEAMTVVLTDNPAKMPSLITTLYLFWQRNLRVILIVKLTVIL